MAEGPQVHSQSAMQMTCKSARVSQRRPFGSGLGASCSQSLARSRLLSHLLASSAAAHPRPAPSRAGLASRAPRAACSAAGGGLSAEPALRAGGRDAPAERRASAPGPPSPRG